MSTMIFSQFSHQGSTPARQAVEHNVGHLKDKFAIRGGLSRVEGNKLVAVPLKDVPFSTLALTNAPAEDAKDGRGESLRIAAISDMSFADGKLLVSGLSNQEFGSTFRSIPFPFTNAQDQASLEIYHAATAGTRAPIKTFTTTEIKGKNTPSSAITNCWATTSFLNP